MGDAPSPSVLYFNPKKSTENFARLCQFLVTICSDIMRDVLSRYIKPAKLRLELDKNRSKLQKITNAQEKDFLYPPHSSASVPQIRSKDLDISLLYKILRNICNIPTHKAGWGNQPVPGDFSLAACIERIRILRNSICGHSTNGTVDDLSFKDYWRELRTPVVKIEREEIGSDKYERGIDHLHDCDLNPTKSKEYVAQIRRNTGEFIMKRERIDLVEEEANAKRVRLDYLEKSHAELKANQEQNHAELKTHLTECLVVIKTDILKELKVPMLQLEQKKDTSSTSLIQAGCKTITRDTSTYTTSKSTTITIKFKPAALKNRYLTEFPMHSTKENQCWIMVSAFRFPPLSNAALTSTLCLLSDIGVIKEIKLPEEYGIPSSANVAINEDSEAVFVCGKSLLAATENGEIRKLFDIPTLDEYSRCTVCCLRSGNYLFRNLPSMDFIEYNKEGVAKRIWKLPAGCNAYSSRVNQNNNLDYILSNSFNVNNRLHILDESLKLKCMVSKKVKGVIIPVLNTYGDLLHGHEHFIDLLDERCVFIKNVYKTQKHGEIRSIAYSNNSIIWILYDSAEIDIIELEIDRRISGL